MTKSDNDEQRHGYVLDSFADELIVLIEHGCEEVAQQAVDEAFIDAVHEHGITIDHVCGDYVEFSVAEFGGRVDVKRDSRDGHAYPGIDASVIHYPTDIEFETETIGFGDELEQATETLNQEGARGAARAVWARSRGV